MAALLGTVVQPIARLRWPERKAAATTRPAEPHWRSANPRVAPDVDLRVRATDDAGHNQLARHAGVGRDDVGPRDQAYTKGPMGIGSRSCYNRPTRIEMFGTMLGHGDRRTFRGLVGARKALSLDGALRPKVDTADDPWLVAGRPGCRLLAASSEPTHGQCDDE